MRNIILIGPMGVGKTTVGKHLAKILNLEFIDTDHEIETRSGVSIPTIFDIEGEEGFRSREYKVLTELCALNDRVIATGGGAILDSGNRKHMRSAGTVIYLRASIKTLIQRTSKSRKRPLLNDTDPDERFRSIMEERGPLYEQEADLVIDTDKFHSRASAHEIARWLERS